MSESIEADTLPRCAECGEEIADPEDCVTGLRSGSTRHIDCVVWDDCPGGDPEDAPGCER